MILSSKHIKPLPLKEYSGFYPKFKNIPVIKKHHYFLIKDIGISGDAPKDFICLYKYGVGKKSSPNTWKRYIAKLGDKHYPSESITEYLLNRIGETLGFNIAKSKLVLIGGQIRFLSEYFLNKDEILEHGAELYAGYLNNDLKFVEDVEKEKLSSKFFTVNFTLDTFKYFFSEHYEHLKEQFILMLFFDALIGNNDRHFNNWGIIRHIKSNQVRFAPIYDTARGLFWNFHENQLPQITNEKQLKTFIEKYCNNSRSKIGWSEKESSSHFNLIRNVLTLQNIPLNSLKEICNDNSLYKVLCMIEYEFKDLMTFNRIFLIKECLKYRFCRINHLINNL